MDYTAVVIGAGPAGAAAARTLARAGVSVLLVSPPQAEFRVGESLIPSAKGILMELGIWDEFLADNHMPCYGNYSAWGSQNITETDFIRSPFGHGWHLDRVRFDAMLRRMAAEAGAVLRDGARLLRFEREGERWRLEIRGDGPVEEITCNWLLDCTGRSRRIATGLGIERIFADRQIAFHARFHAAPGAPADQESRTLVESMPCGWLHTALLPAGERIVTLFTDADSPWTSPARTAEGFTGLVNESLHVARKLDAHGYGIAGEPRATDARSSRLARFTGDGWLAVGDAATAYDPLSSYGILFALHSGLRAGNALAGYLGGDVEALVTYESQIGNVYSRVLTERSRHYQHERRWPESAYWRERGGEAMRDGRWWGNRR